ncbi:MAG: NADH-quinone oxidoreductase subunit NuoE [Ignavibacteriae bacterium]|nr:NADH-quinone oxidoreductase subunit NuoE [Ignavibacteriota bacterium]
MAKMLSEQNLKKLEELKKRYPTTKALLLPVLWMAQEQFGWISLDTMKYVADLLNLPFHHVYGVVTFYTMFNSKPIGKYHIQVCTNVSCMLRGAENIRDHICRRLNVGINETTPDRTFTVTEVECLGSCGTAPMVQVNNDEYYDNLNLEKVNKLLEDWSKK